MKMHVRYATAAAAILVPVWGSSGDNRTMVNDFSQLTASPSLACRRQANTPSTCALLQVPRDYSNPSIGTLNLGIIKKPGPTPDAQEVLVNPGGPGGSSVVMVLQSSASIEAKIGTDYSLVGIDPRGVNNSEPSSDCFRGYPFQTRNAFITDALGPADISSDAILKEQHQSLLAYGKWCSEMYSVNGTAKYASTVATAQDMLHYISLRAQDAGQTAEEAKLWFYGISYGSILGPTFASLYPTRVGRMIIDGVLGLADHYNGGWETAIEDTDKAAKSFFKECFEAGPALCSFHQNATSWQDIENRYLGLLAELKAKPIGLGNPILEPGNPLNVDPSIPPPSPFVLKWTDMVTQFFGTLYKVAPSLSVAFDIILTGLQSRDQEYLPFASLKGQISVTNPDYEERMARVLVSCLDANGRADYTAFDDFKAFVDGMYERSNYGGESDVRWRAESKWDEHAYSLRLGRCGSHYAFVGGTDGQWDVSGLRGAGVEW
ncbi:tap domain-containing protein [Stemphylium lycopersici]|nr:tap domain-containing protein [Stemphylium lycopersici]